MRIRPLWIKIAAVVMTLAVLAALLLCLFSEIRAYRTRITENAQSIADAHTQAYADATEQVLAGMMTEVKAIAIGLQQATTEYEAADIISRGTANSAWIMGSRFMAKGQLYSGYALYTGAPQSEVVRLYESGKEGIVGIVYDSGFGGVQCIVFGVPVAENAAGVTYLMAYCQDLKLYERLDTALAEQKAPGMADIMYLCHDGKMYHPQGIGEHFLASKYNNAFQMMLDVGVPTDAIDPLKNDYYGGRSHSVSFDMDGETYLASLFFLDGTDRTLSIMAIYTDTALIAEDQAFADMLFAIVAAIVLVMVGVLAFAVYCILHKGESTDKNVVIVDILAGESLYLSRRVGHNDLFSIGNTELLLVVGIDEPNLFRLVHRRSVKNGGDSVSVLKNIVAHQRSSLSLDFFCLGSGVV